MQISIFLIVIENIFQPFLINVYIIKLNKETPFLFSYLQELDLALLRGNNASNRAQRAHPQHTVDVDLFASRLHPRSTHHHRNPHHQRQRNRSFPLLVCHTCLHRRGHLPLPDPLESQANRLGLAHPNPQPGEPTGSDLEIPVHQSDVSISIRRNAHLPVIFNGDSHVEAG
ncbi:unnamed protein product [Linum tenue]|uniref:Uncharacterized protein n=1 Tax=Linum tenue TaxID=586396 RepID=A0AAV0RA83_9ROSI|nr:unnamed protein product [Linum tenue]